MASTYLRAVATATQPRRAASSPAAKGERCEPAMKEGFSALDADALKNAADGSIDVEIDGDSATPRLSGPKALPSPPEARRRVRIDSG
jgi:hypothetical protein